MTNDKLSNSEQVMKEPSDSNTITRRTALSMLAAGAGVSVLPWSGAAATAFQAVVESPVPSAIAGKEVVSFFMDLPYIDPTGLAKPYIPPTFTDRRYDIASTFEAAMWSQYC